MLNHLLIVTCICIIIVSILYFFFWNRFIAYLIGLFIRLVYWNQGASSVWVEIGSIHFSLLAGRILLKDIRYHSSNQTIKIVKGHVSWRYWIRRPTTEDDLGHARGGGEEVKHSNRSLSCRIQVSFQGFEWFLYNRTAAYDNIVSQMTPNLPSRPVSRTNEQRQTFQKTSVLSTSISPLYPPSLLKGRTPEFIRKGCSWLRCQLPSLDPKDLLPLGIQVTKGAILCGNASTPNLLVAEFQRTEGTYGIVPARCKHDLYKQMLNLKFQHAIIRYVQNDSYQDPMTAMGKTVEEVKQSSPYTRSSSSYLSFSTFTKLWRHPAIRALSNRNATVRLPPNNTGIHTKLLQTPEDNQPIGVDFSTLEYAIERKILEAPVLELLYYADVVGEIPWDPNVNVEPSKMSDQFDVVNGGMPPEWGIDVVVRSGFLRYGPWADRQRVELQKAFFPPVYIDVKETPRPSPGDQRMFTSMQIFIELREDTTLHIPFREASKNWMWDGVKDVRRPRTREPASIHLTAGDSSSITYVVPMIADKNGYDPLLEVHLDTIAITSSLNDIRLVTAESCRIRCELPSPLKWNAERNWTIAIFLRQPVLYLLRDHINMFTDLAKDWTSGPPSDYQRFIPMVYTLQLEMNHFELNLYANDHNIIDKPNIKDENALLTARGDRLSTTVKIPSNTYRPDCTTISFSSTIPDVALNLSLPRWNTHALHAPADGDSLINAGTLKIDGSYMYFADVREDNIEQCKLTFTVKDIAFKALGWSIRYFMVLRDNYLGSFTHFSTLYEYLDKHRRGIPPGDPVVEKYRPGKSNILQVEMRIILEKGLMILPAGLPGYETSSLGQHEAKGNTGIGACMWLSIPELQLEFRMHDYYMEMSLNIGTINGHIAPDCPEKMTDISKGDKSKHTFLIDGIDITANRLFGPQPRTATYVCIWNIRIGHIKGILTALDGKLLMAVGDAFRLNFSDASNAPAAVYVPAVDPDVTFLKLSLDPVDLTWKAGHAAIALNLGQGLNVESNDLAGRFHRKVTSLRLPHASVKVLLTAPSGHQPWLEAAELVTDAYFDIYSSPDGWKDTGRAQAEFIRVQDEPTNRATRMFRSFTSSDPVNPGRGSHKTGLYLPQPMLTNIGKERVERFTSNANIRNSIKPQRWSNLPHLSESDGEEGVSEADRDARLAQTRITPISSQAVIPNEEQSMTSGDESDNEDLTDTYSSDSDWEDLPNGFSGTTASHYTRIVRSYSAQSLDNPSQWIGTPFVKIREGHSGSARKERRGAGHHDQPKPDFIDNSALDGYIERLDSTVFRFESRKGLTIRLTPLILLVIARLEEEMESNTLSPELSLDGLLAGYLTQFGESIERRREIIAPVHQHIVTDINLTSVHILLFQHIAVAGYKTPKTSPVEPAILDPPGAVVVVDCFLHGVRLSGNSVHTHHVLSGRVEGLSVGMDIAADPRLAAQVSPFRPKIGLFDLNLADIAVTLTPRNAEVAIRTISTRLVHLAPEYLAASAIATQTLFRDISSISTKWSDHTLTKTQNLIYDVLQSSNEKTIVDPLSTIQPSYLVQGGRPHELRTDTNFKFLFHLRNCLWHLEGDERRRFRSMQPSVTPVSMDDISLLLQSRLMSLALDPDASSVSQISVLEPIFPSLRLPDPLLQFSQLPRDVTKEIAIQIRNMELEILHPLGGPSSRFTLASFDIAARVRPHDLVLSSVLPSATQSQASLGGTGRRKVRKVMISVSLREVGVAVSPHLMNFGQQILRVRRRHVDLNPPSTNEIALDKVNIPLTENRIMSADVTFHLHRLRIQAAAQNIIFEFGTTDVQVISTLCIGHGPPPSQSMNHSLTFGEIFLRARSPDDMSKRSSQDILASAMLSGGKVNAVSRQDPASIIVLRLVFAIEGCRLTVPRSALRLYRFIEEWRADFLPGFEATLQELLSELQNAPKKSVSPTFSQSSRRRSTFQIHGHLNSFKISLQIMHGTWLSWEANRTTIYLISPSSTKSSTQAFGLQVGSQVFGVSSQTHASHVIAPRVQFEVPQVSLTGSRDGTSVCGLALMEFLDIKVKPSHWDTLLAVQQKFGQDFNDLMILIQETRLKQPIPSEVSNLPLHSPWVFSGFLKMRGFRLGLEGVSSIVYLECEDINGGLQNDADWAWHISLSDLALSLAPRVARSSQLAFNRNLRSAFVILDIKASGTSRKSSPSPGQVLKLWVNKIHAVMQPSSIGEIGDFIDHLQAEMLDHKGQRALELAAFKEKTKNILKTFEVTSRDDIAPKKSSTLEHLGVDLFIQKIGVAFPLTAERDLEIPHTGSLDSHAVRAFLFSIESLRFSAQGGETGQAKMKGFSFQFVSRFRQSVSSDFSGDTHQTRNRLIYPEMEARLRSNGSTIAQHISIVADVSGFILELDPAIPDYVFSLIDVYRQGKDRVDQLAASLPNTPSIEPAPTADETSEKPHNAGPTSNFVLSLTFLSGKVRVYNNSASKASRSKSLSGLHQLSDKKALDIGAEIFGLPVVSVWGEYRATSALCEQGSQEMSRSVLMFKSTIHSSENKLRPTLLPFVTELVARVEARMRKVNVNLQPQRLAVPAVNSVRRDTNGGSSMQISFSLRIDQSKLELTCQPDVNVIAGLNWDSGGFVVNISPGARKITFSGSVGGLTVGLKHGFLSEDCVRLDARNLAFSVMFAKLDSGSGMINSVSVVLDTEFAGGIRFSRLQDVLCFKAVWLDRIPIFIPQSGTEAKSPRNSPTKGPPSSKQEFTSLVLLRIRHIKLDIDLGQSISAISLDLTNALMRTNLTESMSDVSLSVADVSITAKGNVSGHAEVPNCVFQTIRRVAGSDGVTKTKMLEINLTSGALVAMLESDHQKLIHYRAEPLKVEVFDDWSSASSQAHTDHPLRLSFNVAGSEIVAVVTVGTIPKLMSYANKFRANLDAQRQGASRESKAFRVTRSPKPDNPLSTVANAMLVSARSRFQEAVDTGLSYAISQHMSLRLDLLRLVVFPRTMGDPETAQFIGQDVEARLDRLVGSETNPAERDLHLSFSSMTISKFGQLNHGAIGTADAAYSDGKTWLMLILKGAPEATIVGLPSMNMHMVSEESRDPEDASVSLVYDFNSEFVRRAGMRDVEDIYITLNVSLYSWLTVLRKNLTREMDQVRATADWRTVLTGSSPTMTALRKKVPESIQLMEGQRSATLPLSTPLSAVASPEAPKTASAAAQAFPIPPLREQDQNPSLSSDPPRVPPLDTDTSPTTAKAGIRKQTGIIYKPRNRHIERLTMRQLGEATPDVMHPFFMKKAGFNLEDSLPQYVNEYATAPLEEIMDMLLKLYSRQLLAGNK